VFLTNELKKAGIKSQLVTIEGAGHTPVAHMNDFIVKIAEFIAKLL
jgi:dipeptidyl aminopeptidase/acylaminoacyl peptidase